jgi:hypothetical protein
MRIFLYSCALYLSCHLPGRWFASKYPHSRKLIVSAYEELASTLITTIDVALATSYLFGVIGEEARTYLGEWMLAYFICDLFLISEIKVVSFIHHICGIMLSSYILFDQTTSSVAYLKISLIEASTPFLNFRLFMHNFPQQRQLQKAADIAFFLSFLASRTFFLPWLMWSEWNYLWPRKIEFCLFGGLTLLNFYWTFLGFRKFCGKKEHDKGK